MKKYVTPKEAAVTLDDGIKKEARVASEIQGTKDDSVLTTKDKKIKLLSAMQESLLLHREMASTDKLNFYGPNTQTLNCLVNLEVDSILNGANSSKYLNEIALSRLKVAQKPDIFY